MKKFLVLFGSESDEYVYSELIKELEKTFSVAFEIISAHRDPKKLNERIAADDFDYILAGAGLAAHLPGVCASLTDKPVFGTPVPANFGGLDALLSILQMPFGIPVGTLVPDSINYLIDFLTEVDSKNSKEINIVLGHDTKNHEYANQEYSRLEAYAKESGLSLIKSHHVNEELMNIILVHRDYKHEVFKNALYVPLLTQSEKNSPATSTRMMDLIGQGGIWFGVNNSRNALLFLNKFL